MNDNIVTDINHKEYCHHCEDGGCEECDHGHHAKDCCRKREDSSCFNSSGAADNTYR